MSKFLRQNSSITFRYDNEIAILKPSIYDLQMLKDIASVRSVKIIPILTDNYVFIILNPLKTEAIVVDPGTSAEVIEYLKKNEISVNAILLTHHHDDHIGGALEIKSSFNAPVYAPLKNKFQIEFADHFVTEGDQLNIGSFQFKVIELPGHTLGHVAYWEKNERWLFSGDVLFGLGCGRLFEGTATQMYQSLEKIKQLPEKTKVFCTHEYTETNLKFCHKLFSEFVPPVVSFDQLKKYETELALVRGQKLPSVPLQLDIEKVVNPFLVSKDLEQFTSLRQSRNKF